MKSFRTLQFKGRSRKIMERIRFSLPPPDCTLQIPEKAEDWCVGGSAQALFAWEESQSNVKKTEMLNKSKSTNIKVKVQIKVESENKRQENLNRNAKIRRFPVKLD